MRIGAGRIIRRKTARNAPSWHDGCFPSRIFRCPGRLHALTWQDSRQVQSRRVIEQKEGGTQLEVDGTKKKIREILSVRLNLSTAVEKISDDAPLFGPGSLGLDSIDALELVLGLQKELGVAIEDRELAVRVLVSIDTIAEYVKSRSAGNPEVAGGLKG
jgi:acyl carrier protein